VEKESVSSPKLEDKDTPKQTGLKGDSPLSQKMKSGYLRK
jgi:hypothetical protein